MRNQRTRIHFVIKEYTGWGPFDYLAIGSNSKVIAYAPNEADAKNRAIARGCFTPIVVPAWYLKKREPSNSNKSGGLEKKLR